MNAIANHLVSVASVSTFKLISAPDCNLQTTQSQAGDSASYHQIRWNNGSFHDWLRHTVDRARRPKVEVNKKLSSVDLLLLLLSQWAGRRQRWLRALSLPAVHGVALVWGDRTEQCSVPVDKISSLLCQCSSCQNKSAFKSQTLSLVPTYQSTPSCLME